MNSQQSLSKELRDILTIVADLSYNDINSGVFDHRIIAKANNLPQEEVRNYLDQLKSRGLIREDIQPTDASFKLYMITAEGIQELEDQDQK